MHVTYECPIFFAASYETDTASDVRHYVLVNLQTYCENISNFTS